VLRDLVTLKVSETKYKICYYCVSSAFIFQLLYINVLNYRYFHTNCSTSFKIKKRWKNKNVKTKKKFIHVYYNYASMRWHFVLVQLQTISLTKFKLSIITTVKIVLPRNAL